MALCLADALLEREGKIDPDLIGRNILDWALRFDAFNKNVLGPTSKIALNAIRDGKPVAELENNGVTNGAAMRVSPLGCLLPARDVDSFIDDVALASSPTHKSDLAVAGAVVIAWAISRAIDGESWSAIVDSCLQLRDMHSKTHHYVQRLTGSAVGDCAENCAQCRRHRIRQRTALPGRWRRYQHY
ncbi:hypothetical protein BANRA_05033 [Escherichia coli]|nr:hypothetical protein BANRA_05033 [Escherichia coli]